MARPLKDKAIEAISVDFYHMDRFRDLFSNYLIQRHSLYRTATICKSGTIMMIYEIFNISLPIGKNEGQDVCSLVVTCINLKILLINRMTFNAKNLVHCTWNILDNEMKCVSDGCAYIDDVERSICLKINLVNKFE